MSRKNLLLRPLPVAALLLVSACTTVPPAIETTNQPAEENAYPQGFGETKALADRADPLARARIWAGFYNQDQTLLAPALEFATALRAIGSNKEAIDVAARTAILHPESYELMMVYGRALTSEQELQRAAQVLGQATNIAPERADAYAALGLVYDRAERHDIAQQAYARAIEIDPARPGTLSNYGLSLALSGNLDKGEEMLRRAVATPGADQRIEQNLALILGLQGKFDDMQTVSRSAPARILQQNTEALRAMLGIQVTSGRELSLPAGTEGTTPLAAPVTEVEESVITAVPPSPERLPETETPAVETADKVRPRLRGSLSE